MLLSHYEVSHGRENRQIQPSTTSCIPLYIAMVHDIDELVTCSFRVPKAAELESLPIFVFSALLLQWLRSSVQMVMILPWWEHVLWMLLGARCCWGDGGMMR